MTIFTKERKLLLAVESSCDETSVAVIEDGDKILSNIVASQIKSHQRFGGVVPEVASRHHVEQVTICIEEALTEAKVTPEELSGVAVTYGPGLVGALLIGLSAAKAFAWAHQLPLIPVNHMAGHIYAARFVAPLEFPLMALLVSGGVLGLPYPSGKEIDALAHEGTDTYQFPRAMLKEDNYDFSFSGLKSAFINTFHNAEQRGEALSTKDLAASFQASVVEVLVTKTIRACQEYPVKQLLIAGGVAANQGLREAMRHAISEQLPEVTLLIPPLKLCGDNAAMIGAAAFIEAEKNHFASYNLNAEPGVSFMTISEEG